MARGGSTERESRTFGNHVLELEQSNGQVNTSRTLFSAFKKSLIDLAAAQLRSGPGMIAIPDCNTSGMMEPSERKHRISSTQEGHGNIAGEGVADASTLLATLAHTQDSAEEMELQLRTLKETFDLFDRDGDGKISADEFQTLISVVGLDATALEIQDLIAEVDAVHITADRSLTLNLALILTLTHSPSQSQ